MADAATPVQAFMLQPNWLALDDGVLLEAIEYPSGNVLELRGPLREEFLAGRADGGLRSMGEAHPALARLASALRAEPPRPLDRGVLLAGSGFGMLFLELTARCNERCVHCYAESSPEREEALSWEEISAVIDDACTLGFGTLQLTGGDPLVSPFCVQAAEAAVQSGMGSVEIYTNGLALLGATYERLRELGVSYAFSFYSHDADTHDAITQTPGSQVRTLRAIRQAVTDGCRVRVSVIVTDQNFNQVEATLALLRESGLSDDQLGMDVQRTAGRGLMSIRTTDERLQWPGSAGHRDVSEAPSLSGRAAVSYDGTVYPCIFSRSLPLGSIRERPLREILLAHEPLVVDRARLIGAAARYAESMACWDCRVRAALLED